MSSNQYKYISQSTFNGGIETREELIKDNQVLDSREYWIQGGDMVQRPGTRAVRLSTLVIGNSPSPSVIWTTAAGVDTLLSSGTSDLTSVAFNDQLTFYFSTLPQSADEMLGIQLAARTVENVVTKTRAILEIWTARGWAITHYELVGNKAYPFAFISGSLLNYRQLMTFASPADIESTSKTYGSGIGVLTGYFFRLTLKSATDLTGSPFTAGTILGTINSSNLSGKFLRVIPSNAVNANATTTMPGAYFFKYSAGNALVKLVQVPATTGNSPAYLNNPWLSVGTGSGIGVNTITYGLGFSSDTGEPTRYDLRYTTPRIPPSTAVIPEFNTAFIAYANLVLEVPYGGPYTQTDVYPSGSTSGPLVATVNTDPLIVGPISTSNPASVYPSDEVPQLTAFPAANLIVYFSNQLWAAGILGQPTTVRWSGEAGQGAYNVWPEDNQVQLSTAQDNSEITAIAPLADNLVVFKKNSIWQMIDNGVSDIDLALYEPRLVVAGVGTSSPQSVRAVNGGLIFLAEDGFYFYDGTPNIKRISDPVKTHISDINPARTPFAQAVVWRTKQYYICAVSSRGEDQNNDLIFAYGLQNNDWQVWSGWDVQCWLQIDGVGLEEELWWTDSYGRAYQVGRWTQSDNGAEIDSWFISPRLGFDDAVTKTALELRVRGINNNPTVNFNVIGDDIEINKPGSASVDPVVYPITMPLDGEQRWDDPDDLPVDGVSQWVPERRRERKATAWVTASWFQVKIRKMLQVLGWDLGYENEGRR